MEVRGICDMFGNGFGFCRHSCVPRPTIPAKAGISQQQRQRRVESAAGGKERRWRVKNEIPASAGMVYLGTGICGRILATIQATIERQK